MDFFESFLKTVSSLAVVLALVVLAAAGARRWLIPKLAQGGAQQPLRLVHSLSLGGRRNIMILEIGVRTLVVGATAQQLSLLTEFENREHATVPFSAPAPADIEAVGEPPLQADRPSLVTPRTWREHLTAAAGAFLGRKLR
jgi:flagellar biogenesis protein FliO